jgi:hypothetical protein
VAFDTQYAITDREYDLKIGVKSTAQHVISKGLPIAVNDIGIPQENAIPNTTCGKWV